MKNKGAFPFDDRGDQKRHAPATLRNSDAIAGVLSNALPGAGLALEIASGTGEHINRFAGAFPTLRWQPSDIEDDALASIVAWAGDSGAANILPPLRLDAASKRWPIETADAVLCINMLHISPWKAATGLMRGASNILPSGGLLYLYGPYFEADKPSAKSNVSFDESLRRRNAEWGIRNLEDVRKLAEERGLRFESRLEMPANNLSLLFRKD